MGQVQVLELELDDEGIVVRASHHEGSPWPGVDVVGLHRHEVCTFEGERIGFRGLGRLRDGTPVEYRSTQYGRFTKLALVAELAGTGPLNRLGGYATLGRAIQLIQDIERLTYGFGVALSEPAALIADDMDLAMAQRALAHNLLVQLRDPMALASWLGDAVVFAIPCSKSARLERAAQAAIVATAPPGSTGKIWHVEVACATPPYSAAEVFELLYDQAAVSIGEQSATRDRAA